MHAIYANYVRIRDEKGIRDADVSKATNIPASTFTDWKNGKSYPKLDKIFKIAQYLEIPMETLITEQEEKNIRPVDITAGMITLSKFSEVYVLLGREKYKEIEEAKKNLINNPDDLASETLLYKRMREFSEWIEKNKTIEKDISEMRELMELHPEWFEE